MKIGELAKLTGLTASRIRFYEASGLIRAVDRKANGYRDYAPEAASILDIIASAQTAGFSLDEIRRLLPTAPGSCWQHQELLEAIQRKVVEIESLQKRLDQNKAQLLKAAESIRSRPEDLGCLERAQWVLDRLHGEGGPAKPAVKTSRTRRSSKR